MAKQSTIDRAVANSATDLMKQLPSPTYGVLVIAIPTEGEEGAPVIGGSVKSEFVPSVLRRIAERMESGASSRIIEPKHQN